MNTVFFVVIALTAGLAVGYVIRNVLAKGKIGSAEGRAERIITEAKQKEKELVLAAKDQAIKITEETKEEEKAMRQKILRLEERLEKKETEIDEKSRRLDQQKEDLEKGRDEIKRVKEELMAGREKQMETLEKIAKLTREEAKGVLLEQTEKQVKDDMVGLTRKLIAGAR